MIKWIACGSFTDPKKSKQYFRFSSKVNYDTKAEAESELALWKAENRYTYLWIESVGK